MTGNTRNRPATEEVRARHILVTTEAEALKVLDDLKQGADFATVARVISKDPDGAKGGDLGFFRREQVWPGFADVAFALAAGSDRAGADQERIRLACAQGRRTAAGRAAKLLGCA